MAKECYGVLWADQLPQEIIELRMAFNAGDNIGSLHQAPGFEGAFIHLQRAIDLIWNKDPRKPMLIWNEWSELLMRSWIETLFNVVPNFSIESPENPVTGPSASWKTTCLGCYINCFWLADPLRTKIIPSSTTLGGLKERIWKDVVRFYRSSGVGFGNPVNHPHPKIQTIKGDDSSGIHGIAVEKGDVDDAIDKIKGRHSPNVLVAIDEGTGAQPAIVEACVNLRTGCTRYQLIMLANACDPYDEHGKLSEPEYGWNSVNVDTVTWKTKRGGMGIHLDGHKSPNVLAGKKKYPGLLAQEDLDTAVKQYGENSPRYYQERRGWWAPEGMSKTVLTVPIIEKFKMREPVIWVDKSTMIAACDPAYEGGDRRVLRFAKVGLIDEVENEVHKTHAALLFTDLLMLKVDITTKEPIHFQLSRQIREECKARGIDSYYFGMDVTGEGGGTSDILKREWGQDFLEVEFGGRASDRAVSDINPRKGHEEYFDRVSELWYQFRAAGERNQIRGLDEATCKEFCQRNYDMAGPRIWVESKKKMKGRIGHSPDLADCAVIMLELALVRGLLPSSTIISGRTTQQSWQQFAKDMVPRAKYGT